MNPASNIKRAGNAPGGNKVTAKFPGPDFPDEVQIKGTSDKQPLKGNSGNWISANKYSSIAITLQLIKNGVVVAEYAYDANGNLMHPDAAIINFSVSPSGSLVTISWDTTKEDGLASFIIDRKLSTATTYDQGVQAVFPQGVGTSYNVVDMPPGVGTFIYQLRAVFDNGTEKILSNGQVTLTAPPNAVISNFQLTAASGLATLSWDSIAESGITSYLIDRKSATDSNYTTSVQGLFPAGAGSNYNVSDNPPSLGSYFYRLRATFGTAPDKVLAEQVVTI